MADIKDQLIKDSYNYVLQSDLSTGVVYRIGGAIPVNPIFSSGLTINDSFVYSGAGEQNGYVLTTDGSGYAYWSSVTATTPSSGVTSITVGNGLSANSTTGAVTIVFTGSTSASGDYLPLSGGTVTGNTTFTSGLTINYIDFDTTPNVPSPTGGTLFYDSTTNSLSYKPITNNNDVTVNLGMEGLIRIYNNSGSQINNGKALSITGSTSGVPTVTLSIASGGNNLLYQVDGIATHDIPNGQFGFITNFGVVNDIDLSSFVNGEDIYLSQSIPGDFDSLSNLSFTGRTVQIGHVNDNGVLGKLQINIQNETTIGLVTAKENNILAADNSSTGLFYFTGLTKVSSTQFNVSPIKGWIVDNTTNPTDPSVLYVEYTGGTHTDLYVNTANETFVYLTSAGTISQQSTLLTGQERRENIFLGKLGHPDRTTINLVFSQPDSSLSPVSQLRDMFAPINLINSGVYPSTNGANLQFNTSAGDLYGLGINYISNVLEPNKLSVSGTSPCTFQYRTQTGGTITNVTNIDPLNWDVGGVITPLTGTKATNQRIYLLQNGTFRVQYGQTQYNQLSAAIAGISTEQFTVFPNFRNNAILIGILSVLSTATDLTDTSKAQFFLTSKFGESVGAAGGVSTTNLQQAYNNSTEPEILTNSTLDGLSIRNGTGNADNVTSLLQGQNTAGTTTSFIRADGLISGSSISTPILSGNSTQLLVSGSSSTDIVRITQTGSGNALIVEDDTNPDSTPFVVASDGRVGIGITSPLSSYKLHVRNGTATSSAAAAGTVATFEGSGATYVTVLSPDASNAGITFGSSSDRLGAFVTWNHNNNQFSINTDKVGGFISFSTDDQFERMRITSAGNVGIGTTSPSTNLHVTGNTLIGGTLTATTISATTYNNLPSIYQLTGGTYSTGTIDFKNTTGGTSFSVTGLSKYFVTGSTPTAVTLVNGDRWFDTNSGIELVWITDVDGSQWIQPTQGGGFVGNYLPLSGGTVTGSTNFTAGLTSNTISATTYQNLPVSGLTSGSGIGITNNNNNNFTITYTGSTGGSGDFLPLSGGTVTGNTVFQSGLTTNTLTTFNSGFTHNNSISIDGYSGEVVRFGAGTTYASTLYYYDNSGNWLSSDSNSTSTSTGMLGIGISRNYTIAGSPTTNGILVRGFTKLYYGGWTTGDKLYVADNNPGIITNTAPTTSTYVVRIVGYVVNGATNLIYFCPDNTWVQLV